MIVLLLSYSKNLLAATNDSIPPTGGVERTNSAIFAVPAELIKKANVKMIERNYFRIIVNEQDSIITMKDKYINEQNKIIIDFQKRINDANRLNEIIKNDLNKQRSKNKIIGYSAGTAIIGLIIGIIAK